MALKRLQEETERERIAPADTRKKLEQVNQSKRTAQAKPSLLIYTLLNSQIRCFIGVDFAEKSSTPPLRPLWDCLLVSSPPPSSSVHRPRRSGSQEPTKPGRTYKIALNYALASQ